MQLTTLQLSLRRDPTRTSGTSSRFARDGVRRLRKLYDDIYDSIVERDVFGIQPSLLLPTGVLTLAPAAPRAFVFEHTARKVGEFMKWLEEQEAAGFLETSIRFGGRPGIEGAWSDVYIRSAYQKGIQRARKELRKAGVLVPALGDLELAAAFNQPFHADRVGMIYTRAFEGLKSISEHMNTGIRQSLSDALTSGLASGMAEGKHPLTIAREMSRSVKEIVEKRGISRVRMIARTEVIRAHHEANIAEYEQAQRFLDEDEELVADWELGANPCAACVEAEAGAPYPLHVIRGMIPLHPNCVCVAIPIVRKKKAR